MGFFNDVYKVVSKIPKGKVLTYGIIANICGRPRSARQVGWALHHNTQPENVPCHRVVNRNGRLSYSFAFGGAEAQKALLENEGVKVKEDFTIDLDKYLFDFNTCTYEDLNK
jgi:methylated-DNA-protein-cysteine methyltransferase-like protein